MTLKIITKTKKYSPVVLSGLTWLTKRKSTPGTVKFKVLNDENLAISEGDAVSITKDGIGFFLGRIFSLQYQADNTVSITAYDQLRYFKNKDTRIYKSLTADALLKAIASDYGLNVGACDNTGLSITRVEEDVELFDVINNAIADTVVKTGDLYVLYDDYGELKLKNIESLRLPLLVKPSSAESYTYTSSIDSETYNQVKLVYDNSEAGTKEYYVVKDSNRIDDWGLLQLSKSIDSSSGAVALAESMLKLYNTPVRTLQLTNVAGNIQVRAGSSLLMSKKVKGKETYYYMLVESATHHFEAGSHLMDLTLVGGDVY